MSDPITIDVWRGPILENTHAVDAVVTDAHGSIVHSWGDADRSVIPRSAIKSIQALPLVMTGAAEAHSVTGDELALACSSHSAEDEHVAAVEAWLARVGESIDTLECGPGVPIGDGPAAKLAQSGVKATSLHNCCSGKHAGFITTAGHLGISPAGYITPGHDVQQRVRSAVETMTGVDLSAAGCGIDGCGIPVYGLPLQALGRAMARLVDRADLPSDYAEAAALVAEALPTRSFWISGTGRPEQVVTEAAAEPLIVKGGAEGVYMGALPERGQGFAMKVRDGNSRASEAALDAVLVELGVLSAPTIDLTTHNKAGDLSGQLKASLT